MLTQENIYHQLQAGNFNGIITLLYENGNKLDEDFSIRYAIDIFAGQFLSMFTTVDNQQGNDLYYDLDILFLTHKEGKYKLKDEHIIKVLNLLQGRAPRADLLSVAKDYQQDPFCKKLWDDHNQAIEKAKKHQQTREAERKPRIVMPEDNILGKKYQMEIGHGDATSWIKVFLRTEELIDVLSAHLRKLASVGKVNITRAKNDKFSLTVYAQRPFAISETMEEVELTLENYFSRSTADPIFKDVAISGISDVAYYEILDYMLRLGIGLEGCRKLALNMDEEQYRDYFVNYLDSLSIKHSVTGETFHGAGKTDILIRNQFKEVLMVAECKIWTGKGNLFKAIGQLFERYLTWRDGKAALLIFNTKNAAFTNILSIAVETLKSHPLCVSFDLKRAETSYSFTFRNNIDSQKIVKLELVLFNFV